MLIKRNFYNVGWKQNKIRHYWLKYGRRKTHSTVLGCSPSGWRWGPSGRRWSYRSRRPSKGWPGWGWWGSCRERTHRLCCRRRRSTLPPGFQSKSPRRNSCTPVGWERGSYVVAVVRLQNKGSCWVGTEFSDSVNKSFTYHMPANEPAHAGNVLFVAGLKLEISFLK